MESICPKCKGRFKLRPVDEIDLVTGYLREPCGACRMRKERFNNRTIEVLVKGGIWVPKGRVLMEEQLGRALRRDEKVKFIDGNRYNCVLSNLLLVPQIGERRHDWRGNEIVRTEQGTWALWADVMAAEQLGRALKSGERAIRRGGAVVVQRGGRCLRCQNQGLLTWDVESCTWICANCLAGV